MEQICPTCNKTFKVIQKHPNQQFCCRSCVNKGRVRTLEHSHKLSLALKGRVAWNKNQVHLVCQQCGKTFDVPYSHRLAKFCSQRCAGDHKATITGIHHPLFTRQVRTCQWCGKEVWVKTAKLSEFRFCSRACVGSWVKSHFHKPSSIEIVVAEALDKLQLNYQSEFRIGKYSCDFVLPDFRIAIECDGTYWHSLNKRKKLDKVKDNYLRTCGWQVIRLKESDIINDLSRCLIKLTRYCKLI